ncbi:tRNA pseudouridine(55) synthase TruB [Kordiimonas pumila]|uniref:tRNA pseudouridine synthase B n=1 Tax=Kordiimonas pumila TaxID=2161677 RepID=A0ABV7CZL7_9PROT|nr:tRNA pseudouridine(55) synthase TruB [Kordiimonas pumila]
MSRRRKGNKVDGWLVVDKPLGVSSAAVVGTVKRVTNAQKVGHGGTLDPLASGILPIGLGEATKTMSYIVDATKEYAFDVTWGTSTDSDDVEGEILQSGGRVPDESEIIATLPLFTGAIEQCPPAYSAIKVNGERAYALARRGEEVILASRTVEIQAFRLEKHDREAGVSSFHVTCGKGTYIRSLGRDIALKLGTFGHITALRRLRVGPFALNKAISLEKLAELGHSAPAAEFILPITTALDDIPAVAVSELEAKAIRHGQCFPSSTVKQGTVVLMAEDLPVAIAEAKDGMVRPLRVFNII